MQYNNIKTTSVRAFLVRKLTTNSGIHGKSLTFVEYKTRVQPLEEDWIHK